MEYTKDVSVKSRRRCFDLGKNVTIFAPVRVGVTDLFAGTRREANELPALRDIRGNRAVTTGRVLRHASHLPNQDPRMDGSSTYTSSDLGQNFTNPFNLLLTIRYLFEYKNLQKAVFLSYYYVSSIIGVYIDHTKIKLFVFLDITTNHTRQYYLFILFLPNTHVIF